MDRHQLALDCREVERCGGSVRDFLGSMGAISPWGTWYRLQIEELGRKKSQVTEGNGRKEGVEKTMAFKQILTKEAREKVEQMIMEGKDPKQFLEENGSKNPSAHEYMIKRAMQKKGMTLPAAPRMRIEAKIIQERMNEDGAKAVKTEEKGDLARVIAIKSRKTGIRYEVNEENTEISIMFGLDEVVLEISRLKNFISELPEVMRQLGVDI